VADALSGAYEGQVPFIIDVNAAFKGDSTADLARTETAHVQTWMRRFKKPKREGWT
jgi:hypothetical protein